jgi:hypothetical protein
MESVYPQFHAACSHSSLYAQLSLRPSHICSSLPPHLPRPVPFLLPLTQRILPNAVALRLDFRLPIPLEPLLSQTNFTQLRSLDVSSSMLSDNTLPYIPTLRRLDARCCRLLCDVGALARNCPNLEFVDFSWSGVRRLPSDPSWPRLRQISLSGCLLPGAELERVFARLPDSVQWLSLSDLGQLSRQSLMRLAQKRPPRLVSLDVTGCCQLTLLDLVTFQLLVSDQAAREGEDVGSAWQRLKDSPVAIAHSAILETDDEAGYRKFVHLVAGADTVT